MNSNPDWNTDGIRRALALLDAAGWLEADDLDSTMVGMKMNAEGQSKAIALMHLFRELRCTSPSDFEEVMGLLSWYLNNADLN